MTVEPMSTSDYVESRHENGHSNNYGDLKLNNNDFDASSMILKNDTGSRCSRSKKFTVYLNGTYEVGQEILIELDQLFDWNDFILEIDSGLTFSTPTNEIFSLSGEILQSIEQAMHHESLVVASGKPFIPLPYKNFPVSHSGDSDVAHLPKSVQLRNTLVSSRKFIRSGLTKSVYAIDVTLDGCSSPNNELSSLLKTMSEEQVCYRDMSSTHVHGHLPNSVVRQTLHAKPRPASCYGATHSMYSNEISPLKRSPNASSSRIPKRILPVLHLSDQRSASSNNVTTPPPQSTSSPVKVQQNSSKFVGPILKAEKVTNTKVTIVKEKLSRQEVNAKRDFILPRIVSIIRTGTKPRKVIRYLLNQKTARSFEQVLSDMTERLEAPWGAIRKVFTLSGIPVAILEDFFREEKIFLACPSDRHVPEDFILDNEEMKGIPNCLKLQPGAVKVKSSETQKTTQRRIRSLSPRCNQRATPTSYPTHPKYLAVSQLPNVILAKYFVGDIIGDGNFAVVRECVHRINGAQYALKVIDKTKSGLDAPADHEVRILKSVTHPNIIHLYEDYDFKNELYVVMEHVSGGDLFDTIAQCVKFSEEESAGFTRDIVSALAFLHSKGIVHRDIKPENLLVYHEGDRKRRIKVGDFGLAHYMEDDTPLYTVCGTPTYVAPEILAETGYGYKVDVWALGIILYILLCGYPPFSSSSGEQADLFDLILVGDYEFPSEQWDGISEDVKDLIMKMIESDVDIRLAAEEVLDHPWVCITTAEAESKRNNFFKKDFRFNVFEQMGLTKLGLTFGSNSTPSTTNET